MTTITNPSCNTPPESSHFSSQATYTHYTHYLVAVTAQWPTKPCIIQQTRRQETQKPNQGRRQYRENNSQQQTTSHAASVTKLMKKTP